MTSEILVENSEPRSARRVCSTSWSSHRVASATMGPVSESQCAGDTLSASFRRAVDLYVILAVLWPTLCDPFVARGAPASPSTTALSVPASKIGWQKHQEGRAGPGARNMSHEERREPPDAHDR